MSICPPSTGFMPTGEMIAANQNLCYVHITANTTELLKKCCGDQHLETVGWESGDLCYVAATCRTGKTNEENDQIKKEIESCFATESKSNMIEGIHGCLYAKEEADSRGGKVRVGGWVGVVGVVCLLVLGGF